MTLKRTLLFLCLLALPALAQDFELDISEDADAYARVEEMGYRQVPVVVAGDQHWAGFRPDMIGSLS